MHVFLIRTNNFIETLHHQFSSQVAIFFGPKNGYWNLKQLVSNLLRKSLEAGWQKKSSVSGLSCPETPEKGNCKGLSHQQQELKFTAANIIWKETDDLCQSYEVTETVSKQAVGWRRGIN